jgi:hypothetical protein
MQIWGFASPLKRLCEYFVKSLHIPGWPDADVDSRTKRQTRFKDMGWARGGASQQPEILASTATHFITLSRKLHMQPRIR